MIDSHRPNSQQGVTTLIITMLLIAAVGLFILFVANTSFMQKKTASNVNRTSQTFEAAEAGLEFGIQYFNTNKTTVLANPVLGFISYSDANTTNIALPNGSKFSVTYTNPVAFNYNTIQITSVGTSDDGTSTRTLIQQVSIRSTLMNIPSNPLMSVGGVAIGGSANVVNKYTNVTVDSGSAITFTGSGSTQTAIGGSNKNNMGNDLTQNSAALNGISKDSFSNMFFDTTASNLQNMANLVCSTVSAAGCTLQGATNEVIWINSSATINDTVATSIGTATSPVVLIVNGDLNLNGNTTIYGVVVSFGNATVGNGTAQIIGSLLVSGSVNASGNISVTYNPTTINNTKNNIGTYAKVPGSWRDF